MTDDIQPGNIRPEDVFAELTTFQHALADHVDWLQRWYSAIINKNGADVPDPGASCCGFDRWCRDAAGPFAEFGGFAELKAQHDEVHARAAEITARSDAGTTVTTSDYESLMHLLIAFGTAAQALEREAWKVLATVDPLTGLSNRQSMRDQMMRERDRTIRMKQPCCVALVDVDHFKKINDAFGHPQGDRVLRAIAELLRETMRPYDMIYRYGGEEFLLCLPGADLVVGAQVAERLRREIAALDIRTAKGERIPVTATIGLSAMCAELGVEDTVEQADKALYDGKRGGRNRVMVYGEG
ncbi:MAG TPA: diguanylate cyclase [Candidatus Omnitrophota bacterium]|nr:diguanylate cyclase [Candidatus Omnitrophota bacterium]